MNLRLLIVVALLPIFTRAQDSLFISTDKWGTSDTDDVPVEVGTQIAFSKQGLITHFKYNAPVVSTYIFHVWDKTGKMLYGQPFTSVVGWNRVEMNVPLFLPADTFVVSVYATRAYGSRVNYFTVPKVKGNLTAINSKYSPGSSYPTLNYRNSNYYVDVIHDANISISAGVDDTITLPLDSCSLPVPSVLYNLKAIGPNGLTYEWEQVEDSSFFKTGKVIEVRYKYEGQYIYLLRAKDQSGKIVATSSVIIYVVGNPNDVIVELLRNGTYRTKKGTVIIDNPFPIEN